MRRVFTITLGAHLSLLAGCAGIERIHGNIYEGLKTREAIVHPSSEQEPPEKSMSYQEYELERKKLLERDDKK